MIDLVTIGHRFVLHQRNAVALGVNPPIAQLALQHRIRRIITFGKKITKFEKREKKKQTLTDRLDCRLDSSCHAASAHDTARST